MMKPIGRPKSFREFAGRLVEDPVFMICMIILLVLFVYIAFEPAPAPPPADLRTEEEKWLEYELIIEMEREAAEKKGELAEWEMARRLDQLELERRRIDKHRKFR